MLHKILIIHLLSFFLPVSISAGESEQFATMAHRFVGSNRFILQCELQHDRIINIRVDNRNLRILCLWMPQTKDDEYRLDDKTVALKSEVTHILIGYGQTPSNPLFYYYLPAKGTLKKPKIKTLDKYRSSYHYVTIIGENKSVPCSIPFLLIRIKADFDHFIPKQKIHQPVNKAD